MDIDQTKTAQSANGPSTAQGAAVVPDPIVSSLERTKLALNLMLVGMVFGHALEIFGRFTVVRADYELSETLKFAPIVVACGMVVIKYTVPTYLLYEYRRTIGILATERREQQLVETLQAQRTLCIYCGVMWLIMAVAELGVRGA